MVPGEGVEPSLPCGNRILNPARLPIPPSGHLGTLMVKFYVFATLEFQQPNRIILGFTIADASLENLIF